MIYLKYLIFFLKYFLFVSCIIFILIVSIDDIWEDLLYNNCLNLKNENWFFIIYNFNLYLKILIYKFFKRNIFMFIVDNG